MTAIFLLGFYFFKYFDGIFIILISSQYILYKVLYFGADRPRKILWILLELMLLAIIAYNSAFRLYLSQLTLSDNFVLFDFFTKMRTKINFLQIDKIALDWFHRLSSVSDVNVASLFIALVTGRREHLHLAFSDIIRRSGVSHLVALSGFHLSLLLLGLQYVFQVLNYFKKHLLQKSIVTGISIIIIWLYCLWIGYIPSLYRAAIMYSISSLTILFYGKASFFKTWGITAVIVQLMIPQALYSHGYILSMLALLGIVFGSKCAKYSVSIFPPIIIEPLFMGIGALFFTAWYSYIFFEACYPIGIIASLILTPFISLFMILGLLLLGFVYFTGVYSVVSGVEQLLGIFLSKYVSMLVAILSRLSQTFELDNTYEILILYVVMIGVIIYYIQYLKWKNNKHGINRNFR